MTPYKWILGLLALCGVAAGQSQDAATREIMKRLSAQAPRMRPDISDDVLSQDYRLLVGAVPEVRKSLSERKCAGQPCAGKLLDQGVLDIYLGALQRKGNERIELKDIAESISASDYVYIWSDPADAEFKLVLAGSPVWAAKTNADRFVPKSDYTLKIEKAGYEPAEVQCPVHDSGGVRCGASLKKKN